MKRFTLGSAVLTAAIVCGVSSPATAGVLLDVIVDAYVSDFPRDGNPDAVVNTNALLLERGTTGFPVATEFENRPVMIFNLAPHAGMNLTMATFSAYGTTTAFGSAVAAAPLGADLVAYAGNGTVDLADFSTPGAAAGSVTIPGTLPAGPTGFPPLEQFSTDVTGSVQPLLDTNAAFGEFRLETSGTEFFAFIAAGEVPAPFSREPFPGPQLYLEFASAGHLGSSGHPSVPEPGTAILLGLGFVSFLTIRRRLS